VAIWAKKTTVRHLLLWVSILYSTSRFGERAWSSFRAARSLMQRERRRSQPGVGKGRCALDYANVENVPATLVDLSEHGTAVESERKLPPDCRIYFQFALPGPYFSDPAFRRSGLGGLFGPGRVRFVNVPRPSRRVLSNWLKSVPSALAAAPQVPRPAEAIVKTTAPVRVWRNRGGTAGWLACGLCLETVADSRRHACRLGADVYRMGIPVPNRCSLSDISSGGCYVEMPTPFPAGTRSRSSYAPKT